MRKGGNKAEAENQKTRSKRLMIIEDDAALSEVLANIFNDMGFYCGFETDAPDINVIEEFMPDLIVIDYHLPWVNGGEICEAVKQNLNLCKVPVILISAYSKMILSLEGGLFDSFIEKPFNMEEILMVVKRLLNSSKVQD